MALRFDLRPGVRRLFRLPLRTPHAAHADVDAELDALIAARVDDLIARGMSADSARQEALRRLGDSIETVRHQLHSSAEHRERRMQLHEHLENLIQDLRYAWRGLARRPGFTTVAVLTLAIGIGATTAIFSAVNVLLLRPMPYARPDELMKVTLITPKRGERPGTDEMVWSYPKFMVFRDAQHLFSELSAYTTQQFTVTSGDVERIRGESVGATYLRTLGLAPARGRDFERSEDDHYGAPRQAILSFGFWERRFNADPSVIGQRIDLGGKPYDIIGVAPREFRGLTGEAEIFVPITVSGPEEFSPQMHSFSVVARRLPTVTVAQAVTGAAVLGVRVNDAYPNPMDHAKWGAKAEPLNNARVAPVVKQSVLVLFGAVALVLLVACVNVANLLLGRAASRRREIAVRLAIGAGRGRLVRLLVTESLVLALLGAIASVGVAWIGVHALGSINPATTLRIGRDNSIGAVAFSSIGLDWTALAFTFVVALVAGLVFGLAPAFAATRASLSSALRDGRSDSRAGFRGALSGRRLLVVSEVALALVLLAGSGLMIRSLGRLLATNVGFDARNVLTARINAPRGVFGDDSLASLYTQLLERLRAVPGVADAGIDNCAPLSGGCLSTSIRPREQTEVDMAHLPGVGVEAVSPSWFTTMHVPLIRGRMLTRDDRDGLPPVAVVNEAAAAKFWPNENPIGKRFEIGFNNLKDVEVVGIVGDVRQRADSSASPMTYFSYRQLAPSGIMIFIRTARDPAALGPAVRRAIHDVAPAYPVYDMQTMSARSADATARVRFSAVLLTLFAVTALSLAAIGIYGVMSLGVTSRTREIGIRMALGADRNRVQRLVVREGAVLVAMGAVAGIVGARIATKVLQSLLFDTKPSDPATYVAIIALLAGVAVLASWLPARRAARVDPIAALRAD
jgi:putative ABC transport system permease protein